MWGGASPPLIYHRVRRVRVRVRVRVRIRLRLRVNLKFWRNVVVGLSKVVSLCETPIEI